MAEKDGFSVSERIESLSLISYTIFHSVFNKDGGSISTPVGRIELKERISGDGFNAHIEIRVIIRNDVRFKWGVLSIIKSPKKLNQTQKVISKTDLKRIITELIQTENISEPYTIYKCVENVEDFKTFGEFYKCD